MGFGENGNGLSPADIAAVLGNSGNGNNNGNDAFFGGGSYWIIVLLIMVFLCGGVGNGAGLGNLLPLMMMNGGGGQASAPAITPAAFAYDASSTQRGFDQAALMGAVEGVRGAVTQGNADNALGLAGLGQVVTNGFGQAEIAANNRQMANMNQNFTGQMNTMQGFNQVGGKIDMLGADVAREACADRQAVSEGLMNLTAQNNMNTNTIVTAINNVGQNIKDLIFEGRLEAKDEKIASKDDIIAQLRQENLYARGQASQIAQNGQIVDAIYSRLSQCPVGTTPVYGNTPIFTCSQSQNPGCPCGGNL